MKAVKLSSVSGPGVANMELELGITGSNTGVSIEAGPNPQQRGKRVRPTVDAKANRERAFVFANEVDAGQKLVLSDKGKRLVVISIPRRWHHIMPT